MLLKRYTRASRPPQVSKHQLPPVTIIMSVDELGKLKDVVRSKSLALSVLEYDHEKLRIDSQRGHDRQRVQRLKNEAELEELGQYLYSMI